jgi:DNA-binding transcriptional LysR family regulator
LNVSLETMELRHLRYFVAVAEELHFGRAARRLKISQPPLSQQIQALEQELGVSLFDRSSRQVHMTRAGTAFLASARGILEQVHTATLQVREVHRGQTGILRIGHAQSASLVVLPAAIQEHRARFPHVALQFEMHEDMARMTQLLHTGGLDLGIARTPVRAEGLVVKTLAVEPMVLAVPDTFPIARREVVDWEELRDLPFIHFPRHVGPDLYDHIDRILTRRGVHLNVVMESTNLLSMLAFVAAGSACALVLDATRSLARAGVTHVRLAHPPEVGLGVVYRAEAYTGLVPAFVSTLRKVVKLPHV